MQIKNMHPMPFEVDNSIYTKITNIDAWEGSNIDSVELYLTKVGYLYYGDVVLNIRQSDGSIKRIIDKCRDGVHFGAYGCEQGFIICKD